jgi:single-stranded-DNA-specific exonuclease
MDKVVNRINAAIANEEKILIFGDYDCDGICATSILKLFFNSKNYPVFYYIPKRQDGYGLNIDTLEYLVERYLPDLFITVVCGISAVSEVLS